MTSHSYFLSHNPIDLIVDRPLIAHLKPVYQIEANMW